MALAELITAKGTDKTLPATFICHPTEGTQVKILSGTPSFQSLVTQTVSQMQKLVPPYMLPSVFIPLSHIPLTVSRKIDRKLLQAMAS